MHEFKKKICLPAIFVFVSVSAYGEEHKSGNVPVTSVFHNLGQNIFDTITYNYGANFMLAGLGTKAFIDSGLDWRWRNFSYEHQDLAYASLCTLYLGYAVPIITPAALYLGGMYIKNEKLQLTGLALVQALAITCSTQSILKFTTGRSSPGILWEYGHMPDTRTDDFSGEFNWFNREIVVGWPSGHTANAFAAAAVISEMYPDNLALKIGAFSYAAFIGIGVSISVHWVSEVFAGALIGYAAGKTVGKSFARKNKNPDEVSFYVTPNSLGVILHM